MILSLIVLGVSILALAGSLAAWWMTKGTWLLLARSSEVQAETWRMLDRYDLARQASDDAAKFERWAWPRQKAGAS